MGPQRLVWIRLAEAEVTFDSKIVPSGSSPTVRLLSLLGLLWSQIPQTGHLYFPKITELSHRGQFFSCEARGMGLRLVPLSPPRNPVLKTHYRFCDENHVHCKGSNRYGRFKRDRQPRAVHR